MDERYMQDAHYTEPREAAAPFRAAYCEDMKRLAEMRCAECAKVRTRWAKDIFAEPERYRAAYVRMLGWPLGEPRRAECVSREPVCEIDGARVERVTFETMPGLHFSGLLYTHDGAPRPLVISQHGGLGTPELCGSLYESGSSNYNDQTRRLMRWDVNVFAPQLLLWRDEDENGVNRTQDDRLRLDRMLKACGGSIIAAELYCMQCVLDWLCLQPFTDPERIGMAGLSYGGLYTMLFTALDTRILSAVSCSSFGGITKYGIADWSWQDSALSFADAEIAALCWPRRIALLMGDADPLFSLDGSLQQAMELRDLAGDLPVESRVKFDPFPGTHEFCWDDRYIDTMMADLGAVMR